MHQNLFSSMTHPYELAKTLQADTIQRLTEHQLATQVEAAQAGDADEGRSGFMIRYHLRSLMYRLAPRFSARMML